MISLELLLIILAVFVLILIIVLVKQLSHVKVWIDSRIKEDQPFVRSNYLEIGEEGTAGEVFRVGAFGKPAVGIVRTDEKSIRNNGYVEVLMTDMNDDAEKPIYRRTGYISFDKDTSVDQFGYIYKQVKGKKDKELIGYLARPSKPDVPTIYGERTWKSLWLKCTLNAYLGTPNVMPEEKGKDNKDKKEPEKPIECLCINGRRVMFINDEKGTELSDMINEIQNVPEEPVVEEPVVEEPVVEEPVVEEPIVEEPVVEEPVAEEPVVEEPVAEEPVADEPVVEEPTPEPIVDPFAALSNEEKARLDQVKVANKELLDAILDHMIKVEGGTFTMGNDPQADDTVDVDGKARGMVENNESPKHQVTLRSYYIGQYPITQAEWTAIMGNNPSDCQDNPKYPVAPVNWYQSQDFILKLSYLTGVMFTMPTEAQWEFAARGGVKSKNYKFAGSNTFSEVGWADHKHEVGAKAPNELGIYDMSGLVREWCSDLWGHYSEEAQTDPVGPAEDSPLIILNPEGKNFRAVRSPSGNETVSNRKGEIPELDKEFKSYGIRIVAMEMPPREKEKETDAVPVKPLEKMVPKKPIAICSYWGFHSSKKDFLPAEARAGAFALLQRYAPRQRQPEYASEQPYGWKDTALLSALIYTVIFLVVYLVNTGVFQMPMLEHDWISALIFVGYYFILWAVVRFIKIDAIENANSFQPMLDLFNKNLGMKGTNVTILIFALIAIVFTLLYFDYDFLPMIVVIAMGVAINMTLHAANKRWKVVDSFLDDTIEDNDTDEDTEPQNPQGDISKAYEWDLDETYDATRKVHGSLTLYFKAADIKDIRHMNPFFSQRKDYSDKDNILSMFHFLKKYKKTFLARTNYVAYSIGKIAEKYNFSPLDKLQFTIDFVQEPNIMFQENADNKTINFYDDYIRYPDETLYDKCGDSNSKSLLAAMLFHLMGNKVLYLISRKHQHSAVGVEVKSQDLVNEKYGDARKIDEIAIRYEGRYYIFCETTGDKFSLGTKVAGMSLDEFDEKILLPVRDENDECDQETDDSTKDVLESRIYAWDLDSMLGNKLQGRLPLEISSESIAELRKINPFATYGQDGSTYAANVSSMFDFLRKDPSRRALVHQIAEYCRSTVKGAGYPDLDVVQFALDFVQAPNINYMVDAQSASIEYAKEYMRFPDEVLFDKEGDCDCKSSLAAALFMEMGYNVIFMLSQKLQHAAIGIECTDENWLDLLKPEHPDTIVREYNGKQYLYCETTGDGFRVGCIKENESIQDFETIVELSL